MLRKNFTLHTIQILSFSALLFSQLRANPIIDSLKISRLEATTDMAKVDISNEIAFQYLDENLDSAAAYAKEAYIISQRISYTK